jgi:hypothetical protein
LDNWSKTIPAMVATTNHLNRAERVKSLWRVKSAILCPFRAYDSQVANSLLEQDYRTL